MKKIDIKIDEFVDLLNNYAIYGENGYYIEPLVMTKIIVDNLHLSMSYNGIIEFIKDAKVTVTEAQVKEYLDKKFELENLELKQKIEVATEDFGDELCTSKNSFDSYSLEYFRKYVDILKDKSLKLFYLVDKIQEHKLHGWYFNCEQETEWNQIEKLLIDYDIKLNVDGNIYYLDLIRLLTPLIQNVLQMKEVLEKANNLETYLGFAISNHSFSRDRFAESELYPRRSLQVKDIFFDDEEGYIPLSEKQKAKINKRTIR